MGEIKSVKVDNWGVFFLQKLQNFFNKTDYCDLTLQFRDNSQLKVHRLVLSACTDYFNVLEQTCEVVDDAIIMPDGLQADVVVPIVNFMYTGTLEFELKMYSRLLRTAKDMNMTVLLKLLEAHRRTMEMHPTSASGQAGPKSRRRTTNPNLHSNAGGRSLIQTNQGNKRIAIGSNVNIQQNRNVSTGNVLTRPMPVRQIGSTTFTRIKVENEQQESNIPISGVGGYSLIKHTPKQQPPQPTSPFEQLRKGYNNNKRPAVTSFVSPPAKKPNLEDVKEFAEQQRVRKQIAAEFGDDDYDASNIMDDDTIHNDDDDDEMVGSSGQTQTSQTNITSASAGVQTVAPSSSQQTQSEDPPGTTTIIVKHEGPDKPPTIVVKDNSNSKMNHAKIISEVLRQYPHLIKSNKNIKLKIMPNAGGQAQKIIVKKETLETEKQMLPPSNKVVASAKIVESQQQSVKTLASNIVANRPKTIQQQQSEISPSAVLNSGGAQASANKQAAATSAPSATATPQKRRIDSKTMHALIALGAENMTGPWLCLRCGRNGHPISIPSYRGFRRHLINTHKEVIDSDLCEHCGWRSASKRELHFHMQLEHNIKTNLYIFPECQLCKQMCIDSDGLNQHLIDSHPDENKQQCIYCNKIFPEELQLYTHMKTFHKKQALEDGIIDYSDDENQTQMNLPPLPPVGYDQEIEQEQKEIQQAKKVKILSDISLPIASSIVKTDSFAQHQTEAVSAEYLHDQDNDEENIETKFVAADGSEVILTAEQRKEILSQLHQEHEGSGVVMVLNTNQQQQYSSAEIQSDQGIISQDETSQATTATNEQREEDDEEQIAEEQDEQQDDQIYNEMKTLHSNQDDSTTQSEAEGKQGTSLHEEEHEQEEVDAGTEHSNRTEHLEESKESIDNLEWAENLISEHDLADEVSSRSVKDNKQEEQEEIKDEDNKSQDEISKKLKELTGDWSEDDDDDDDIPQEPLAEIQPVKETVNISEKTSVVEDAEIEEVEEKKTRDELVKDQIEKPEFEEHLELLDSLQNTGKVDSIKENVKFETSQVDSENIDEDDIDIALKSLHKEDIEDEKSIKVDTEDQEKIDESEKKEDKKLIKPSESVFHDITEFDKNEDGKLKIYEAAKTEKTADENPEEKLVKELETVNEPEASSSTLEVDEETKRGLIESLLSEQAETMENTAIETPDTAVKTETVKVRDEFDSSLDMKKDEGHSPTENVSKQDEATTEIDTNEEFLNNTPEKNKPSVDNVDASINIAAINTSDSEATEKSGEATISSAKEDKIMSSEDRVKNLISEWGDDDEDEDENDTDLTANL